MLFAPASPINTIKMEASSSKDAAAKQRIINHMNADHQDSLIRYLEHFCLLSSFSARNATLTDVTLGSLTIETSSGSKHVITIRPAMGSWSEVRERVVAMDAEAVAGLHRSNVTVKKYKRPKGWMIAVFLASACTFVAFSMRSNFEPGSFLYDNVLKGTPRFARFCHTIQPLLIYPMLALHASEAAQMGRSRLRKHTVPMFSKLWWKWILSTFVEGVGAFIRFDRIVKEEEEKKAKVKH
ncbi:hypothetical protein MMC24_007162 [Lignoscripta atroalba]|nr:hypothetical protein [Lignoscripta atroalba]